jgi:hypothetical protein
MVKTVENNNKTRSDLAEYLSTIALKIFVKRFGDQPCHWFLGALLQ